MVVHCFLLPFIGKIVFYTLNKRFQRRIVLDGFIVNTKGHGGRIFQWDLGDQRRIRHQGIRQNGNSIPRCYKNRNRLRRFAEIKL
nr:MAG TPA: hypothetical protein [Caudoviricetes sp.]